MDVRPFWCDDEGEQAVEDALRATCKRYGVAYIEPGGQHYGNELDHRAIKAALAKKARSARRRALRAAITRAPPPLCVCCSLRLNEAGENLRQLVRPLRPEDARGRAVASGSRLPELPRVQQAVARRLHREDQRVRGAGARHRTRPRARLSRP